MFLHPQSQGYPIQKVRLQPHSMQHQTTEERNHRVRLSVGGDKLTYDVPVSTPTADLIVAKIYWNSILSTPYGKYLIMDFKTFYLKNLMKKSKYYKISIKLVPQDIIETYDLNNKQNDRCIYV